MAKNIDRPAELNRLHSALRSMDIPDHKKRPVTNDSLRWLAKNLGARNGEHPAYAEACGCLGRLGSPVGER